MNVSTTSSLLIPPYGGRLIDLVASTDERQELTRQAISLPSIQLSPRLLCDLELLATGAFSPLDRFMCRADYERTLGEMRLSDGTLFPIPVALRVAEAPASTSQEFALRDPKNEPIAILTVEEVFEADPTQEAVQIYGTADSHHPVVAEMSSWGRFCVSGRLRVLNHLKHYDFPRLRVTPAELRRRLELLGRANVVACDVRDATYRGQQEIFQRIAEQLDASLLLQFLAGIVKPGDMNHYTRVRAFHLMFEQCYDRNRVISNVMPLATRLAGPRETLWHAIIQRNCGANHLLVPANDTDAGKDSKGEPFYKPGEALEMLNRYGDELGIKAVPCGDIVYLPGENRYEEAGKVSPETPALRLSEADVQTKHLATGERLPDWYAHSAVADLLAEAFPPRRHQGFCVWFTGLPSSGKSTIAEILAVMLMEHGRQVTVLDGDVVRTHLSKGLGFSKEDRDLNILRIGFVASEIVRHHGVVICAAVSPYRMTRNRVRSMVGEDRFLDVYLATPVEVCEQRDVKKLYAKARAGQIKGFTGVDDPYEPPLSPALEFTTVDTTAEESAAAIVAELEKRGFLVK